MKTSVLKLASLNVERSKHLDRIVPFFVTQQPDIICFQELVESDMPRFTAALGGSFVYAPELNHPHEDPATPAIVGSGLWSRSPIVTHSIVYYVGEPISLRAVAREEVRTIPPRSALISVDVAKGGKTFRLATTHFTWTPDGRPTDNQRRDLGAPFAFLAPLKEFVLTGDFNAPRGGEIWSAIALRYADNIPAHYTTSIDPALHRKEGLALVVDGLFTTPRYEARDVRLIPGLSDHMAIVAEIALVPAK